MSGDSHRCGVHIETDFQNFRVVPSKSAVQIQGGFLETYTELRPHRIDGALLGHGHMALAQSETADTALVFFRNGILGRIFWNVFGYIVLSQREIR